MQLKSRYLYEARPAMMQYDNTSIKAFIFQSFLKKKVN